MITSSIVTIESINTELVKVITAILALPPGRVIIETMAGIRPPKGLYIGLWWQSIEHLPDFTGDSEYEFNEDTACMQERRLGQSHVNLRITAYGELAYSRLNILRIAFDCDSRIFDLWKLIGFSGTSEVNDISTEWQGVIHQRAYFDLYFYANIGQDFSPADYFEKGRFNINNTGDETYPREEGKAYGCCRMS